MVRIIRGKRRFPLLGSEPHIFYGANDMPREGVEPTWPCGRWLLKPVRLPVSPPRREFAQYTDAGLYVSNDDVTRDQTSDIRGQRSEIRCQIELEIPTV